MDMKITLEVIRLVCQNVTDEQRAYCAEHLGGADFPERVIRDCTLEPGVEFRPAPLTVDELWELINSYEAVSLQ